MKAGGTDIQVTSYSVPALADWNADGLPDLLVGEKFDTVTGKVRVYLNNGRPGSPVFGSFFYVKVAGSDLTVPAAGCLGAYPRVHDWNQDGKKDLLIGLANGTIGLYLNTGTAANPSFGGSSTLQAGVVAPRSILTWATVPPSTSLIGTTTARWTWLPALWTAKSACT